MTIAPHNPLIKPSLYDHDFHAWTQVMAEALRSGDWSALDVENLVEEIESLGRRERQELENRLAALKELDAAGEIDLRYADATY
jgi:Domain of unknown function DUF29